MMAVDRPPTASVLTLALVSFRLWQQALWERGKRGLIAFSSFPSGRFSFLFWFFFLCGKVPISSAFPQIRGVLPVQRSTAARFLAAWAR
jgi:hypothetical protein